MCFGPFAQKPAAITPVELPPKVSPPPTPADPQVALARGRQRSRAALAGGRGGTITTAGLGLLAPAQTALKTLVGV